MSRKSFSGAAVPTTLTGAINNSQTTFPVAGISNFPDTTVGPFIITVDRGQGTLEEKMEVGSYTGSTLNAVTRGFDGTTAQPHAAGASVNCTLDAGTINEANMIVNQVGTVVPSTSAVGDSPTDGTSITAPAAGDHKHGRETFGTGASTTPLPGGVPGDGTSAHPARADHAHGLDPFGTLAQTTTSAVGDAVAAGTLGAFAHADHKHGREGFGVGLSTVSSPLDAVADGTSLLLARADHKHGREAGMRTATVTVITPGPPRTVNVTMTIGGGTITGIPVYTLYTPTVGDLCYVLELGNNDSTAADLLALGTVVAAAAAPPVPSCRMYLANPVAVSSGGGFVQVQPTTQDYAYGGLLISTNAVTVNAKGLYNVNCQAAWDSSPGIGVAQVAVYKNGSGVRYSSENDNAQGFATAIVSDDIDLALNDVLTFWVNASFNGNIQSGSLHTWLSVKLVTLHP